MIARRQRASVPSAFRHVGKKSEVLCAAQRGLTHKAQGLTLENVFIDFDSGMFAHGQAYVAFSRARSLEGLEISRPLRPRDLVMDRKAFAFGDLETLENTDAYLLAKFKKAEDQLV